MCRSERSRARHERQTGSQSGEECLEAVLLSACPSNLCGEHLTQNAGLDESQAGTKVAEGNGNNLRYADDTTVMVESAEDLKILLMRVRKESEKAGLRFNIQKAKVPSFMANRWGKVGTGRFCSGGAPRPLCAVAAALEGKL